MIHEDEQMEDLFGPNYQYSDYKRGEVITYRAEGTIKRGEIIWIEAPGLTTRENDHPVIYWVGLEAVYPADILVDDEDEPTLEHCPYCNGWHPVGTLEQCLHNREGQR
jgi:hypothetical protein